MKKWQLLLSLGLFYLASPATVPDKLYLSFYSNTQSEVLLSNLSKITFTNGSLKIKYSDNTDVSYSISTVRKIAFSEDYLSATENIESSLNTVSVYPNPSRNYISIINADSSQPVYIYNMSGMLVMSIPSVDSSRQIDISALNQGLYCIKTNNQTIKFSKL